MKKENASIKSFLADTYTLSVFVTPILFLILLAWIFKQYKMIIWMINGILIAGFFISYKTRKESNKKAYKD